MFILFDIYFIHILFFNRGRVMNLFCFLLLICFHSAALVRCRAHIKIPPLPFAG